MLWLLALLSAPAHAEDLTLFVASDVTHVSLTCGPDRYEADTSKGQHRPDGRTALTFPIRPGRKCQATLTQQLPGDFEQLGSWNCTAAGCARVGGANAPTVSAAPGQLRVLMAPDLAHTQLELTCVSGYRERTAVSDHQGVFTGLKDGDDCTLNFKGGPPMKFKPIGPGVWQCHLVSDTPVCQKR